MILMNGKIIKLLSGIYTVQTSDGVYQCRAKGSFRNRGISPVPGDDVEILGLPDHTGRIEQILPRRNYLIRPNVSNIDVLCYVSSFGNPSPFPFTIDKMLVIAQAQQIHPVLIFNKTDLPDVHQVHLLIELYTSLGFEVHCVSAESGEGMDSLRAALQNKTVIFAGNTGVGKSSILNILYPALELETGEISEKLGRGRHTTRHIELYPVNGALIGDTPGFGALELEGYPIKREDLATFFPEFKPFFGECIYLDCSHITEQDCAIRHAVEKEQINPTRYENYCQIYQYLKESESPWNKKSKN